MPPIVAAMLVGFCVAVGPADGDSDAQRAFTSYVAMQRYFFDARKGLYRETYPAQRGRWATAWPVSQAVAATILMAQTARANPELRRSAERRLRETLRRYDRRRAFRASIDAQADLYYDDNVWIALDLLDWYRLAGDRAALARATRLFGLVVGGWDTDARHPCPGGVFWTRARGVADRNTVSTAGGALLGLQLYELTRRPEILFWSRRMAQWVDRCLAAPDGL